MHVEDIAAAHVLALESQQPGRGRFYNIGTNQGVTVNEIIVACEKAAGRSIKRVIAERRPGDPGVLIASADKLSSELGWNPRYVSIDEIVESAYRWHQRYPNGYQDKQ